MLIYFVVQEVPFELSLEFLALEIQSGFGW